MGAVRWLKLAVGHAPQSPSSLRICSCSGCICACISASCCHAATLLALASLSGSLRARSARSDATWGRMAASACGLSRHSCVYSSDSSAVQPAMLPPPMMRSTAHHCSASDVSALQPASAAASTDR
jgi:hypothetical protein